MNDGLVRGRPGGGETGEFCVDAFALQHIGGRYRLAAFLVRHSALNNCPVDAPGEGILGRVDHILKAAVDDRFERVKPRLRSLALRVTISGRSPIVPTGRAIAAGAAVRGAPVIARRSTFRRPCIAVSAITRLPVLRAPVWRGPILRSSRPAAAGGRNILALAGRRLREARRPPATPPGMGLALVRIAIIGPGDIGPSLRRTFRSLDFSIRRHLCGAGFAWRTTTTTAAPARSNGARREGRQIPGLRGVHSRRG